MNKKFPDLFDKIDKGVASFRKESNFTSVYSNYYTEINYKEAFYISMLVEWKYVILLCINISGMFAILFLIIALR